LNNNAEFIREKFKIFIEAIRDIPAGGEILVSYGKEYWQVIRKNQRLDAKKNGKPAG
jgi:SET domain-containing protein